MEDLARLPTASQTQNFATTSITVQQGGLQNVILHCYAPYDVSTALVREIIQVVLCITGAIP